MSGLRVVPQSELIAPGQRTISLLLLEIYNAIALGLKVRQSHDGHIIQPPLPARLHTLAVAGSRTAVQPLGR